MTLENVFELSHQRLEQLLKGPNRETIALAIFLFSHAQNKRSLLQQARRILEEVESAEFDEFVNMVIEEVLREEQNGGDSL